MFCFSDIFLFYYLPSLSIYSRSANISPVHSNRALSSQLSVQDTPPYCWLATSVFWDSVRHCGQKGFFLCMFKEQPAGPPLLRLMYIVETLINPLFTDVAFWRDSKGDGSGHYESGGSCPPPSAICVPVVLFSHLHFHSLSHRSFRYTYVRDSLNLALVGQCTAEFSSNPNQTHQPVILQESGSRGPDLRIPVLRHPMEHYFLMNAFKTVSRSQVYKVLNMDIFLAQTHWFSSEGLY